MRKVSFVRLGVIAALAAVGTAGVVAVGCSSDDTNPATGDGGKDSTSDVVVNPADTGATDTGTGTDGGGGGDADAGKQIVKLVLVHAAPDVGAFRLCFGTAKAGAAPIVTPLTPLPDAPTTAQKANNLPPGIYPGTGGPLPNFPIDVPSIDITPFLLFADQPKVLSQTAASATEANCPELIGTDGQGGTGATGLVKGVDYVQLPTVAAGSFSLGNTYLLAVSGCFPTGTADKSHDNGANKQKCGDDYDGQTGNFGVGIATLDTTTPPPDGGMNISFAHRASVLQGNLGQPSFAANGIIPGTLIPAPPPDAGPADAASDATDDGSTDAAPPPPPKPKYVAVPFTQTPIKFSTDAAAPAPPVPAVGLNPDLSPIAVFLPPAPDGGTITADQFPSGNLVFALPLNVIQYLSTGNAPNSLGGIGGPSMFTAGENYTFVILGDPNAQQLGFPDGGQNPAYDGHGLHIIAFPNHLAVPSL